MSFQFNFLYLLRFERSCRVSKLTILLMLLIKWFSDCLVKFIVQLWICLLNAQLSLYRFRFTCFRDDFVNRVILLLNWLWDRCRMYRSHNQICFNLLWPTKCFSRRLSGRLRRSLRPCPFCKNILLLLSFFLNWLFSLYQRHIRTNMFLLFLTLGQLFLTDCLILRLLTNELINML